ncbi:hypothetical protein PCANC_25620 [Puccinia coronata f. sp. avenae]|uniref:Uncharacterized protein n=1 Tax=Puccinia coronata f. sp. avenae TaxID=200324 RepID=A0A2N5TSI3_9BASI|nr:hypothetical protein PCANC_25620 [Puccinia coronata f. sp. avenae]
MFCQVPPGEVRVHLKLRIAPTAGAREDSEVWMVLAGLCLPSDSERDLGGVDKPPSFSTHCGSAARVIDQRNFEPRICSLAGQIILVMDRTVPDPVRRAGVGF